MQQERKGEDPGVELCWASHPPSASSSSSRSPTSWQAVLPLRTAHCVNVTSTLLLPCAQGSLQLLLASVPEYHFVQERLLMIGVFLRVRSRSMSRRTYGVGIARGAVRKWGWGGGGGGWGRKGGGC